MISYTLYPDHKGNVRAIILAVTANGEHFTAVSEKGDELTVNSMTSEDPTGRRVLVSPSQNQRLIFNFETSPQEKDA